MQARIRQRKTALVMAVMMVFVSISSMMSASEIEFQERTKNYTSSDTGSPIQYTASHSIVTVGPPDRTAILEMPGGHDYSRPLPLVVALHGFSNSGTEVTYNMGLTDSIHDNEHLLLRPDGTQHSGFGDPRFWNATDACCSEGLLWGPTHSDDVNWLEAIVSDAVSNYGADPEGIIFMGFSNGGFMSHRMACDRGSMMKAIVALNGVTWNDFNMCPNTGTPDILHVHATSDTTIEYEGGNNNGNPFPGANATLANWAVRKGCDSQRVPVGSLDLVNSLSGDETDKFDYVNCNSGERLSHWRINDGVHNDMPFDGVDVWADEAFNWAIQGFVRDSDGDGYRDDVDAFIYNPNEWIDADGDGVGSNTDACDNDPAEWRDTDGDGYCVPMDLFPNDPNEWFDTDEDGVGDNADLFPNDPSETVDSDGDGVGDNGDAFPLWPGEWADSDGDGIGDNGDAFPNDPNETIDTDGDGVGNNADAFPGDPSETTDTDGDGYGDNSDAFPMDSTDWRDRDGDGVGDNADVFPNDPAESIDSDGDGVGNNADAFPLNPYEAVDSDGDGIGDNGDAFPDDETETGDMDGDGVGNNADAFPSNPLETQDSDGDGFGDNSDAFPNDPSETADSDGDGVGDNGDVFPYDRTETVDSDGDGVGDNADVFPDDPSESSDSDGDGFGDNEDAFPNLQSEWKDTDGDGVGDNSDKFPMNPDESKDSDLDGVGDNSDYRPYDSEVQTKEDLEKFPLVPVMGAIVVCLGGLFVLQTKLKRGSKKPRRRARIQYDEYDYDEEYDEDYQYEEE